MKELKVMIVALVCLLMTSTACLADDYPIPVSQLPAAAKTFVQKYFPAQKIVFATKDHDSYDVRLDDGTEIDFTRKGAWDNVDCKFKAVPAELVPAAIKSYVTATFPETQIVKIDKERYGFEIELSNDLELKFDKKGRLLEVDD